MRTHMTTSMTMTGAAAALVFGMFAAEAVSASTLTTTVSGTDNLYYSDWGSANNGIHQDVTGRGNDVFAVGSTLGAVNFSGLTASLSASGSVMDDATRWTGANGDAELFNGLRVYSLIGVWSSTADSITAIGDSFFIGTSATLVAPDVANAYLFLGENDGIFSDNEGGYRVSIELLGGLTFEENGEETEISQISEVSALAVPGGIPAVPVPASFPLLALGLGGLGLMLRRKSA